MEDLTELESKLHRVQADIEQGIGHLARQRAVIANDLADGKDVTHLLDLLAMLEDAQLIDVQHRSTETKTGWGARREGLNALLSYKARVNSTMTSADAIDRA
jgi:hypothetical protein